MTVDAVWPQPARLSVGIVSPGRVGSVVGHALERAGHVVSSVVVRSAKSDARVRRLLPESQVGDLAEVASRSELVVISVPDPVLKEVVLELADAIGPSTMVVHTSGAFGVGVLAPLAAVGCVCAAIHPVMTFTGGPEDVDKLQGAPMGVTAAGDVEFAVGHTLALEMGGEPFRVDEDERVLYHAAIAHAANHVVTLIGDAADALDHALGGLPAGERPPSTSILGPIVRAAVDNAIRQRRKALTGPASRGDRCAVMRHIAALEQFDDEVACNYRAMAQRTWSATQNEPLNITAEESASDTPKGDAL